MTDAFKKLINCAPWLHEGDFVRFMFASNGIYDGFWGKNGYDKIILLGQTTDGGWYRIASEIDSFQTVFNWMNEACVSIDIPSEYGVPSLFFHRPIHIKYDGVTSTVFTFIRD